MKKENIDEDLIEIIDYLDDHGFKPFASCDGVLSHHDKNPGKAYIAFLESPKIMELLSLFKDDPNYQVTIGTSRSEFPREYLGNKISGKTYGVYFYNSDGELTKDLFDKIKAVVEERLFQGKRTQSILKRFDEVLDEEKDNLSIQGEFSSSYPFYMKKEGTINSIEINTKENKTNKGYRMDELALALSKKFGINAIREELSYQGPYDDSNLITYYDSTLKYYFTDDEIDKALEVIRYSRKIKDSLDFYLMDPAEFIENMDYKYINFNRLIFDGKGILDIPLDRLNRESIKNLPLDEISPVDSNLDQEEIDFINSNYTSEEDKKYAFMLFTHLHKGYRKAYESMGEKFTDIKTQIVHIEERDLYADFDEDYYDYDDYDDSYPEY